MNNTTPPAAVMVPRLSDEQINELWMAAHNPHRQGSATGETRVKRFARAIEAALQPASGQTTQPSATDQQEWIWSGLKQDAPRRTLAHGAEPVAMRPMYYDDGRLKGWYIDHPEFFCDIDRETEGGPWSVFFRDKQGYEGYAEQPFSAPPVSEPAEAQRHDGMDAHQRANLELAKSYKPGERDAASPRQLDSRCGAEPVAQRVRVLLDGKWGDWHYSDGLEKWEAMSPHQEVQNLGVCALLTNKKEWAICPETDTPCSVCPTLRIPCEATPPTEAQRLEGVDAPTDALREVRRVLELENNKPNGAIADTIWRGPGETLFDFIDNTLAAQPTQQGDATIDAIMSQAQVMASAWSLVGGRFDFGGAVEQFEEARAELRAMIAAHPVVQAANIPTFEQFCKNHGLDPEKMESGGGIWARAALEDARAAVGVQAPAEPAGKQPRGINEWFLSLPEGRRNALLNGGRWQLADAAYDAGRSGVQAPVEPARPTVRPLIPRIEWLAYEAVLPYLIADGRIGQWVVIKDIFMKKWMPDYESALAWGYEQYGSSEPFFVKMIEPPLGTWTQREEFIKSSLRKFRIVVDTSSAHPPEPQGDQT